MSIFKDLTGQIFGRLIVLERDNSKNCKGAYWICQCNCEDKTIKSIASGDLLRKVRGTKSCGCLAKETNSKIKKRYNIYDLSREYGVGYTSNTNEPFYFDLEDYDLIKDYCWHKDKYGYICTNDNIQKIMVKLSRIIMNIKDEKLIADHIEHNLEDNRKNKLRIVTHSQNTMNSTLRNDNTSGAKGVQWHKRDEIWEVYVNGKYIGRHSNFETAVCMRKEAEEIYQGEFSYDYSMNLNNDFKNKDGNLFNH